MKICYMCSVEKAVQEFDPGRNRCKECRRRLHREKWNRQTPEQKAAHVAKMLAWQKTPAGALKQRRARLKHRYGLTEANYDLLLERQGGTCALCPAVVSQDGRRLAVDHDHETGVVRGVLCLRCNSQIALVDRLGTDVLAAYIARGRSGFEDR